MFRKSLTSRMIRQRFAVTLTGNEGTFLGVLVEQDRTQIILDSCETPAHDSIPGRMWVARDRIAYLQEIPA